MSKLFDELTPDDMLTVEQLQSEVDSYRTLLVSYPPAKLWMQCLEMISLIRELIKAERTGNWCMHLSTLAKMLPYFAASGHNNYTKGSCIFLQSMDKLEQRSPAVYQKFSDGYHVVRQSCSAY